MEGSARQGDRDAGKAGRADEAEGVEKRLPGLGLDCLLSTMLHYTMDVKSAPAGTLRKSFGDCWLEPFRGCSEDAIFAGFPPSPA